MSDTQPRPAYVLSAIVAVLMTAASTGRLFADDAYRDDALVPAAWYGNDLMTLVVAVPLLFVALMLSMRGSQRAQLVPPGMLDYTRYNSAFYLFGAAFNRHFLVYVALFTLSLYALMFGLANLNVRGISQTFHARTPVKWISAYMLLVALMLGGLWTFPSLTFIRSGRVSGIVVSVGCLTNVIAALDLSLVVSALVLGAAWLWQRQLEMRTGRDGNGHERCLLTGVGSNLSIRCAGRYRRSRFTDAAMGHSVCLLSDYVRVPAGEHASARLRPICNLTQPP